MILIDYSGIAIAPVIMEAVKADDLWLMRHMILNSIRMYRKKFKEYGEVVIVADNGGNWRKEVYPQYKFKRHNNREESSVDWDVAFQNINTIFEEIGENFPYKTIKQWGCEADDSIAEIVKWTQEFGNHEEVMIVSSDKDFKQLHKFPNVNQFSAITKKIIKVDDARLTQLEHFITGDGGDGVPNCLSPDNTFSDDLRQERLTAKKKAMLIEDPRSLGDEVYRNFLRNKKMIDLTETSECPENIKKEIINKFVEQDPRDNKNKVMNFFIKNQCRGLLEVIEEFI